MSEIRVVYLHCDYVYAAETAADGKEHRCERRVAGRPFESAYRTRSRANGVSVGWLSRKAYPDKPAVLDYCPEHKIEEATEL